MHYKIKQKGSVVVFAVLVLSAILGSTIGLVKIFLPRLASVNNAIYSTTAVYTADTVTEHCLYNIYKASPTNPAKPQVPLPIFDANPKFTVASIESSTGVTGIVLDSSSSPQRNDCVTMGSESFQFRAQGSYHGTIRALEIGQ